VEIWTKQFLRLSDGQLPNIFISAPKKALQIHINKKTREEPQLYSQFAPTFHFKCRRRTLSLPLSAETDVTPEICGHKNYDKEH